MGAGPRDRGHGVAARGGLVGDANTDHAGGAEDDDLHAALASLTQLRVCEPHPARWTYLSPPALLEPGERTGRYRRGTTTLLLDADGRSRISAEDLAVAVLDELENPGGDRHFTVAY
ncbi:MULTISPECIES: hypothetical protein [Nocardia]|uniref:hypothetical protein n=1 Tax=Nocardia TaxID=1817 RepID=UPI002694E738